MYIDVGSVRTPDGFRKREWDVVATLDILLALVLLVFVAPLLLAIGLGVCLFDGGPAIFAHERLGRGGRAFRCLKFRSMAVDADERLQRLLSHDPGARQEWEESYKLRDDPRVTPLGRFLRKSSLDELPQLINVLRGEMSLVGPRPIVRDEIRRYGRRYGRRYAAYCAVRPGITGLWQVSGRSDVGYRRRVAMDVVYSRQRRVWLYLYILAMTAPAVLFRRGAY